MFGILVVSLFDFNANWFEPLTLAASHSLQDGATNSSTIKDALVQATSSILPEYIVSGMAEVVSAVKDNAIVDAVQAGLGAVTARAGGGEELSGLQGTFVEWAKGILRKEWRIQCLDLIIRL